MAPLWICYVLGQIIGLFFYLSSKKRHIAFKNIKSVFPAKTNREIKTIIRKNFRNLGLGIVESLIARKILKYVRLEGKENITKEGGILVAIHEGSWELYNFYIANSLRYKMFAKEQKKKNLDRFLNELRNESSLGVCFSLKETIKSLNDGYMVGLVIDHGAEDNALLVDFFTHLVPTPKGALYLAKKLNKHIYPCFGYRKKGFSHVIEIGKPIDPTGKDDLVLLKQLNRIYEKYLQMYPWEYLWFYKRFKRKKDLDITIISDGKIGHLKQSQAFLSIFMEQDYTIRSKVIEIKYKNQFTRFFAELCALICTKSCLGCGRCLGFIIAKETMDKLNKTYADIVVSTGSIVAPVNRIFASYLGAKSVVILRPNIPLRKFDLSVIPEHDRIDAKNSVKIKGALSYPTDLKNKMNDCRKFFDLSDNKKIAFFLGGPLSNEKKYVNNLKIFTEKLKEFSLSNGYKILLSTSRRTQKDIEDYIEKTFAGFINTEAIVYPSRTNYDFVFDGFASLSEAAFVSNESISMISEVISLKKPCVCVPLEQHLDKHKVFLQSIEKEVIFLDYPYDIKQIPPVISVIFEENRRKVEEGIKRLL